MRLGPCDPCYSHALSRCLIRLDTWLTGQCAGNSEHSETSLYVETLVNPCHFTSFELAGRHLRIFPDLKAPGCAHDVPGILGFHDVQEGLICTGSGAGVVQSAGPGAEVWLGRRVAFVCLG